MVARIKAGMHQNLTFKPNCKLRGSFTAVTCPNVADGLVGYAPVLRFVAAWLDEAGNNYYRLKQQIETNFDRPRELLTRIARHLLERERPRAVRVGVGGYAGVALAALAAYALLVIAAGLFDFQRRSL